MASTRRPTSNDKKPDTSPSLRTAEAARYLDVSEGFLAHARIGIGTQGPAYIRIGRAVRYRIGDLDAFLEARRVSS